MNKKMTKKDLFLKLAQPNNAGKSRWVNVSEFTGEYADLAFGNGASWARKESSLAKEYVIEFNKKQTHGNKIDAIRLNGKKQGNYSQHIKAEIKREIKKQCCIVLGTSNPEVDHKNGRKNEDRVMRNENQKLSDFQPLSKAANDAKRQFCKECKQTGIRFDAKVLGYPMSYYQGDSHHSGEETACIGCFWYDVAEFRRHLQEKKK